MGKRGSTHLKGIDRIIILIVQIHSSNPEICERIFDTLVLLTVDTQVVIDHCLVSLCKLWFRLVHRFPSSLRLGMRLAVVVSI